MSELSMLRIAGLMSSASPPLPKTDTEKFFLFFTVSYGARRNLNEKIKNYYSVSFFIWVRGGEGGGRARKSRDT